MSIPVRAGVQWIDKLFDACVWILFQGAKLFGTSYNAINIWVFCVIWPILTLVLVGLVAYLYCALRRARRELARSKDQDS